MAFCGKCGSQINDTEKFCPQCGAPVAAPAAQSSQFKPPVYEQPAEKKADFSSKVASFNNTADTTDSFDAKDVTDNKAMGILAYFGPLCFIPMFAAKGSKFARFHANQGLILLIACAAYYIAGAILSAILLAISWRLYFISAIIYWVAAVFFTVLAVLGIINAAKGRAKELPLIGKIKILK